MGLNFDIFQTPSGYLKIVHTVFGSICLGILGYYSTARDKLEISPAHPTVVFFTLVAFGFFLTSFCLLISFLVDEKDNKDESIFEIMYHLLGSIFYLSASAAFIAFVQKIRQALAGGTENENMLSHVIWYSFVYSKACLNTDTELGMREIAMKETCGLYYAQTISLQVFGMLNAIAYASNAIVAIRKRFLK